MLSYTISLFIVLGFLTLLHVYFQFTYKGRLMKKIKGPRELPLLGNMFSMYGTTDNLFKLLRKWGKEFGPVYKLSGCDYRTINLSSPVDIEVLLSSSHHSHKDLPYAFFYEWLGRGLLVSNGRKWRQRRKLLTPAFHFNVLTKFLKTFCEQTEQFLDTVEEHVGEHKTDVIPLVNKFTLQTMCESAMGVSMSNEAYLFQKFIESVDAIGQYLVARMIFPLYFGDYFYMLSPSYWKQKWLLPILHKFTKHVIEKRRKIISIKGIMKSNDEKSKPIMLDILLDEEKKGNITAAGIQEEVDTFLFEGHDTTAAALIFFIMSIANEQEIQNLIYEELADIFCDSQRDPTNEDLYKMKYLEYCIKESLRLYPSVPIISRFLFEESTMSGHKIPKHTYYNVHIFDVHRNPDIYPDPDKFIPERFLPENAVTRHPFAYLPFSAGPRNCIGQKFAMMKIKTVISGLLRKYRLEPVTKPEDLVFHGDLVLRVHQPIYVRFYHRKMFLK